MNEQINTIVQASNAEIVNSILTDIANAEQINQDRNLLSDLGVEPAKIEPAIDLALTERLNAQINLLQQSQSSVNITEHRRKQLLATGSLSSLNKLFFEKLETWKKDSASLDDEMKKSPMFDIKFKLEDSNEYQYLKQDVAQFEREFSAANDVLQSKISALANARTKIWQLENKTPEKILNIIEQIDLIEKGGFYTFDFHQSVKLNRGSYCFYTSPVYLSYKNPAAGINIQSCPFGRFKIIYNILTGSVKVLKLSKNIEYSGYYHPHISGSGSVCWGNAATLYKDACQTYDMVKALNALQVILTNYNDQSPYKPIQRFDAMVRPEVYKTEFRNCGVNVLYSSDYTFRFYDLDFKSCLYLTISSQVDSFDCDDYESWQHLCESNSLTLESAQDDLQSVEMHYYKKYSFGDQIESAYYYKTKNSNYVKAQDLYSERGF
jgi:predicted  nucleic acid-binding Zn-ribbon protein